jgi:hypothetical protein
MVKMNWGAIEADPSGGARGDGPDAEPGPPSWDLAVQVDRRPELREESFPDVGIA